MQLFVIGWIFCSVLALVITIYDYINGKEVIEVTGQDIAIMLYMFTMGPVSLCILAWLTYDMHKDKVLIKFNKRS